MPTPRSNSSLATSPAPNGRRGSGRISNNMHRSPYSPNPNSPQAIFDASLFMLDTTTSSTVSQPLMPALPRMPSASPQRKVMNGAPARSPSVSYYAASPSNTGATPDSSYSYDSGYLDPRSSTSPSAHEMNGISGNTTPGFETLDDLPEDLDLGVYRLPTVNIPEPEEEPEEDPTGLLPNSAGSGGYPPSPRLTASPHPHPHSSPKVIISRSEYNTPIVKIENSPPFEHHASPSSSATVENTAIRRGHDGSWTGGIGPSIRGDEYLEFSLEEQEFQRLIKAKNADVEEWLRMSAQQLPRQPNAGGLQEPKVGRIRSKSVSDFRGSPAFVDGNLVGPAQNGTGNVNGIVINNPDNDSDDDGDDDDNSSIATTDSAWKEGSLDGSLPPSGEKELPPSDDDLKMTEADEEERIQRERETDPAFLPKPKQFFSAHPWYDIAAPVTRGAGMNYRNQPFTSNAAMMRFRKCAENIETASRVATFGSNMTKGRRNSAGDADHTLPGPLKRLSFGKDKDKNKNGPVPARRPSLWGSWPGLRRSRSNAGDRDKEKEKEKEKDNDTEKEKEKEKDKDKLQSPVDGRKRRRSFSSINGSSSPFAQGILGPAFGQPSLRVETSNIGSAIAQMASPLMAAGAGANKPSTAPAVISSITSRVKRSRSKSELPRKHIFGMVSSLVAPALGASPSPPEREITPGHIKKKFTFGEETQRRGVEAARKLLSPDDAAHRHGDDEMDDGDFSPLSARTPGGTKAPPPKHIIIPTLDGFAQNVRMLAPGLSQKLVDRIAHEQCKRFKKLVDHRHKHITTLKANGQCANGAKCRKAFGAIGVGSDRVVGVTGHKRGNGSCDGDDHGFDSSDENNGACPGDGNVAAAQFPTGVPTPPVSRLPAEFECPICFKTKRFNKPSDWTKHVHEDVQPFTCTFPDCTEPKSFKRKADWVRHENERHRHLEWWACNQPDCSHTCYRKDNFVQHLVREHKMPEPKIKTQKNTKDTSSKADLGLVWQIVDTCHQETKLHPSSEKCRFCGSSCSTWKKLTVHLARHMETISLPVLELIKDDAVVPITKGPRRHIPSSSAPCPPPPQRHQPITSMDLDSFPPHDPLHVPPNYNLTPPQHPPSHLRTRSAPTFDFMPYNDYQYHQQQQQSPYHHRSPQPQQVYSQQTGFDGGGGGYQFYPTQQSYPEFIPTSAPPPQNVAPMGEYAYTTSEAVGQFGYLTAQGGV